MCMLCRQFLRAVYEIRDRDGRLQLIMSSADVATAIVVNKIVREKEVQHGPSHACTAGGIGDVSVRGRR